MTGSFCDINGAHRPRAGPSPGGEAGPPWRCSGGTSRSGGGFYRRSGDRSTGASSYDTSNFLSNANPNHAGAGRGQDPASAHPGTGAAAGHPPLARLRRAKADGGIARSRTGSLWATARGAQPSHSDPDFAPHLDWRYVVAPPAESRRCSPSASEGGWSERRESHPRRPVINRLFCC